MPAFSFTVIYLMVCGRHWKPKGIQVQGLVLTFDSLGSVCKVRTQDPENLDEEVKSLVTAWRSQIHEHMPGTTKDFQAKPGDLFIYKFLGFTSGSTRTTTTSQGPWVFSPLGPLFSLWVLPWVLGSPCPQGPMEREPMRGKVPER